MNRRNGSQPKRPARFATLCGRIFHNTDSSYFPHAPRRGRVVYFCTEACLGAFLADPDIFYKVHRNSEKDKGPIKDGEFNPVA